MANVIVRRDRERLVNH